MSQTQQRERMRRHLAAGAQISMARSALAQAATGIALMYGDESEEASGISAILKQMDGVTRKLTANAAGEMPEDISDTVIGALYHHTPVYMRPIVDNRNDSRIIRFWLSGDNQRAAIACYLLAEAKPSQPGKYSGVAVVMSSGSAELYVEDGEFAHNDMLPNSTEISVKLLETQ